MTPVASGSAVGETRCQLSQVTLSDRLAAKCASGVRAGCSAVHQDKSHMPPPNEKQNTVSSGNVLFGGGAHRWFLPSGLSRLCSTFCVGTRMYFPSSRRLA